MVGLVLLLAAAGLLWWGAELFVEHAVSAGHRLGTTVLAVGLLLAGAEPEELITAVVAALRGRGGIAAGDAIGANVTMLTLVLGLAAMARPMPVGGRVPRYLGGAGLLGVAAAVLVPDGLGRVEGMLLVVLYVAAVTTVWRWERRVPAIGELAELEETPNREKEGARGLMLALTGVAVLGAERVVAMLGVSDSVVGLSLVALATTAELFALAVAAVRRDVGELAVAGLVGSAGYNATMTLGGAAIARPIATTGVAPAAWLAAALPFLILGMGGRRGRLGRVAGGALVVGYFAYLIALYQ